MSAGAGAEQQRAQELQQQLEDARAQEAALQVIMCFPALPWHVCVGRPSQVLGETSAGAVQTYEDVTKLLFTWV